MVVIKFLCFCLIAAMGCNRILGTFTQRGYPQYITLLKIPPLMSFFKYCCDWFCLELKCQKLSTKFGVRGIPTFIVLEGETGRVLDADARSAVASCRGNVEKVIKRWESGEAAQAPAAGCFIAWIDHKMLPSIIGSRTSLVCNFEIFYWWLFNSNFATDYLFHTYKQFLSVVSMRK